MIDKYFKRPLLYDYLIGSLLIGLIVVLLKKSLIKIPAQETLRSLTTDISTVSLTFAGFILTMLTVLISFKLGAKVPKGSNNEEVSLFDLFFSTRLYIDTINLLKGCIISLGTMSIVGFTLKLFLKDSDYIILFLFNTLQLTVVALTFARSLLILFKIVGLHKEPANND